MRGSACSVRFTLLTDIGKCVRRQDRSQARSHLPIVTPPSANALRGRVGDWRDCVQGTYGRRFVKRWGGVSKSG